MWQQWSLEVKIILILLTSVFCYKICRFHWEQHRKSAGQCGTGTTRIGESGRISGSLSYTLLHPTWAFLKVKSLIQFHNICVSGETSQEAVHTDCHCCSNWNNPDSDHSDAAQEIADFVVYLAPNLLLNRKCKSWIFAGSCPLHDFCFTPSFQL